MKGVRLLLLRVDLKKWLCRISLSLSHVIRPRMSKLRNGHLVDFRAPDQIDE